MGQWGDFGYAVRYHFGYERILNHFYGGTRPAQLAALHLSPNPVLRVVILENLDLQTNVGYDPVVTSPALFTVTGEQGPPGPPPPTTTTSTSTSTSTSTTSTTPTSTSPTTTSPTTSTSIPVGPTGSSVSGGPAAGAVRGRALPGAVAPTSTTTSTTTTTTTATTMPASTTTSTGASTSTTGAGGSGATSTTSPSGTSGTPRRIVIRPGRAVDLRLTAQGTWNVYAAGSCGAASAAASSGTVRPIATGLVDPVVTPASTSPSAPLDKLLTLCRHDGVDERLRGRIQAYDRDGYERTLNLVPLESYVAGVVPGEVSASWGLDGGVSGAPQNEPWGFQALEAQAVAARSYALATAEHGGWNTYADICDSTYCESYVGASYETPVSDLAVRDTAGEVRVSASGGAIVSTTFSASSGGYTAPTAFPAVPDLGDACVDPGVPLECNPVHSWATTVSAAALQRAFPSVGVVLGLGVLRRNRRGAFGGRALSVEITGTRRRLVESGTAVAAALGLRSDWFAIAAEARVGAPTPSSTTSTTTTTTTTTTTLTTPSTSSTTTVPMTTVPMTTVPMTTVPVTTPQLPATTAVTSGAAGGG